MFVHKAVVTIYWTKRIHIAGVGDTEQQEREHVSTCRHWTVCTPQLRGLTIYRCHSREISSQLLVTYSLLHFSSLVYGQVLLFLYNSRSMGSMYVTIVTTTVIIPIFTDSNGHCACLTFIFCTNALKISCENKICLFLLQRWWVIIGYKTKCVLSRHLQYRALVLLIHHKKVHLGCSMIWHVAVFSSRFNKSVW